MYAVLDVSQDLRTQASAAAFPACPAPEERRSHLLQYLAASAKVIASFRLIVLRDGEIVRPERVTRKTPVLLMGET